MKKTFLFAAIAGLMFASCTNDEQMFDDAKRGQEIRFAVAPQTAQTRAEHDKAEAFNGNLKIWAWKAGTADVIINGEEYNTAGGFTNGKSYYYPVDGSAVDFLAVPMTTIGTDATNSYFEAPVRTTDGKTTMNFATPAGVENHVTDVMTTEVISKDNGTVAMILRHLMAKLNITVKQSARENDATKCLVTLNDLQIQNTKTAGAVALDQDWTAVNNGDDCMWDSTDGAATWDVVAADHDLYDASGATSDFVSAAPKFILPQELAADVQKLYIKYTVLTEYKNGQPAVTEEFEKTIDMKDFVGGIEKWAMNKNITYVISINPLEVSNMITFEFNVEEWGVQESNPNNFDRLNP